MGSDDDLLFWDDSEIWAGDDAMTKTKTEKGHAVNRKCMHMMGGRLCFCQFMQWIDSPKYHCHPQESMFAQMNNPKQDNVANAESLNVDNYMNEYDDYDYFENDIEELDEYYDDDAAAKMNEYDIELYDDEAWDDYEQEMNEGWDAESYFDADYDFNNIEYAYDYNYYFGQSDDEQEDEQEFEEFDNRWVRHKDEPLEMKQREHPQQQKYAEHNLFIYNNYDDDIEYKQKKYIHRNGDEEQEEESNENEDGLIGFDALIEINSHLFWLLSLFAVFFGILLCSALSYYFKKREQFMLEFIKQFGPGIISKGKYGFTPINVPLTHSDSDEDTQSDDNECIAAQNDVNENKKHKFIEDDSAHSADEFLSNQLI